jgi:hypothetical protein
MPSEEKLDEIRMHHNCQHPDPSFYTKSELRLYRDLLIDVLRNDVKTGNY